MVKGKMEKMDSPAESPSKNSPKRTENLDNSLKNGYPTKRKSRARSSSASSTNSSSNSISSKSSCHSKSRKYGKRDSSQSESDDDVRGEKSTHTYHKFGKREKSSSHSDSNEADEKKGKIELHKKRVRNESSHSESESKEDTSKHTILKKRQKSKSTIEGSDENKLQKIVQKPSSSQSSISSDTLNKENKELENENVGTPKKIMKSSRKNTPEIPKVQTKLLSEKKEEKRKIDSLPGPSNEHKKARRSSSSSLDKALPKTKSKLSKSNSDIEASPDHESKKVSHSSSNSEKAQPKIEAGKKDKYDSSSSSNNENKKSRFSSSASFDEIHPKIESTKKDKTSKTSLGNETRNSDNDTSQSKTQAKANSEPNSDTEKKSRRSSSSAEKVLPKMEINKEKLSKSNSDSSISSSSKKEGKNVTELSKQDQSKNLSIDKNIEKITNKMSPDIKNKRIKAPSEESKKAPFSRFRQKSTSSEHSESGEESIDKIEKELQKYTRIRNRHSFYKESDANKSSGTKAVEIKKALKIAMETIEMKEKNDIPVTLEPLEVEPIEKKENIVSDKIELLEGRDDAIEKKVLDQESERNAHMNVEDRYETEKKSTKDEKKSETIETLEDKLENKGEISGHLEASKIQSSSKSVKLKRSRFSDSHPSISHSISTEEKQDSQIANEKLETEQNQEEPFKESSKEPTSIVQEEIKSKKRRWGAQMTFNVIKEESLVISSDSLKGLIPDVELPPIATPSTPTEEESDIQEPEKVEHPVPRHYLPEPVKQENHPSAKPSVLDSRRGSGDLRPEQPPSPARNPVSNIIHIQNLVRPFTLTQLKDMLRKLGKFVEEGFWIDKIKSKCYATYATEEEAQHARESLHRSRWPACNPKTLSVDFASHDELEYYIRLTEPDRILPPPPISKKALTPPPHSSETKKHVAEKPRDKPPVREWDLGKIPQESPERPAKQHKKEKKESRKETQLLDDLFRKTTTMPCIYWLPLTEEQATKREEERKKEQAAEKKRWHEEETRLQKLRDERIGRERPRSPATSRRR